MKVRFLWGPFRLVKKDYSGTCGWGGVEQQEGGYIVGSW